MAKDVASVASPVSITVKKNASAKDLKATAEGKVITLAMDTKLMQGTYDVTITGLEDTALTASVNVEKDETLTSYKISDTLALESLVDPSDSNKTISSTSTAICKYYALNQYEEPMLADSPTPTCTFGTATIDKPATATVAGEIKVTDIPAVLAIQGTKGIMTLVDGTVGVNTSQDIAINVPATPAEVTVVGTYNVNASKMQDIVENDKLGNFYILLTAKDQYGWDIDKFTDDVSISIAGGLTNVATLSGSLKPSVICTNVIVDGKEYIAIKLATGTAGVGSYIMTIVNAKKGMLVNGTYDVAADVVVKSISVSADNGIYAKQENELGYEIIDANGNSVTDYATIMNVPVKFTGGTYGSAKWVKNADGTAKLIFDCTGGSNVSGTADTASIADTIVANCNKNTSSNYFVKPLSLTVRKARVVKAVQGLDPSQSTSITPGTKLKISPNKIVYVDQYSNKVTKDKDTTLFNDYCTFVTTGTIAKGNTGCSIYFEDKDSAFTVKSYGAVGTDTTPSFYFESSSTQNGTATVYLKYAYAKADRATQAGPQSYDAKFTVSNVNTDDLDVTGIKIKSINDGNVIKVPGITPTAGTWYSVSKAAVTVVATVGGQETIIPSSQWDFVGGDATSWSTDDLNLQTKTKKCTLEVLVTTWGKGGAEIQQKVSKDYEFSYDGATLKKVSDTNGSNSMIVTGSQIIKANSFGAFFKVKDQYGQEYNSVQAAANSSAAVHTVSYEVTVTNAKDNASDYKIVSNGTNKINLTFAPVTTATTYKLKIVAKCGDTSKEQYVTVKVNP